MANSFAPVQFLRTDWNPEIWTAIDNSTDQRTSYALTEATAGTLPYDKEKFQIGCVLIQKAEKQIYLNTGTEAIPVWLPFGPNTMGSLPTPFIPGQYLTNDGTDAFWALVDLATGVTGVLDVSNIDMAGVEAFLLADNTWLTDLANNATFLSELATTFVVDLSTATGILPLDHGGTGEALVDPGADKILAWDDTDGSVGFWSVGTGLDYDHATHTLNSTGGNSASFIYGESIAVDDYVFQATNDEVNISNAQYSNSATDNLPLTTVRQGSIFETLPAGVGVSAITVKMSKANTPTGNLVMRIFALSGGLPTGAALATSSGVNSATLTGSLVDTTFTFPTPFVGSPSTQYGFVVDPSGTTVGTGGNSVNFATSSASTGLGRFISSDSGASYSTVGTNSWYYVITNNYIQGRVYLTDTAVSNTGPYRGFALDTDVTGATGSVQIGGIKGGLTLTEGDQLFTDLTTRGGVTQTLGDSMRSIGTAISTTEVLMGAMKKTMSTSAPATGTRIPADGLMVFKYTGSNNITITLKVSSDNFVNDAGISYTVTYSNGSLGGSTPDSEFVTVPVLQGGGWTATGGTVTPVAYYKTIHG